MAEGPLVHYYAQKLRNVLEGERVQVEFGLQKLKPLEQSLNGLAVEKVEALGKQIRMYFSDDHVLLVHLMMWGSWRIYKRGQSWDKPRRQARAIIKTETHEAVVFSAPVVMLLTRKELNNDTRWSSAGPDPLRNDFSLNEFLRRLHKQASREIGEVLLDQHVIAGLGNILRIEILFSARIHPRRLIQDLSEQEIHDILRWILQLSRQWLREMGMKKKTWIRIYRKSGKPCPVCSRPLDFFRQAGRITYACLSCQR